MRIRGVFSVGRRFVTAETFDCELSAIQFVLAALIEVHPDKKALLREFDNLTMRQKIASTETPDSLRKALGRCRRLIELAS
jgi:hypothetical protein